MENVWNHTVVLLKLLAFKGHLITLVVHAKMFQEPNQKISAIIVLNAILHVLPLLPGCEWKIQDMFVNE